MNIDKLIVWILGIVVSYYTAGRLDELQRWAWIAQSKVVYESRASNWGSPRFFKSRKQRPTIQ